ncbi:YlxR family protein [Mycoplasma sp. Ms02]|nr:YlxR family protein [Mycoplasma sp. Ms02]
MSEKTNYTRKCVATNQIVDIDKLIRFDYKKSTGIISLDLDKNKDGRGCYIQKDWSIWEKFRKTKGLNRSFKTNVEQCVYEEIEQKLKGVLWQEKIKE